MALKQLVEKRNELHTKQALLAKVFEEAKVVGDDGSLDMALVKCLGADLSTLAKVEKVNAMNKELDALGLEVEALVKAENAEAENKARGDRFTAPAQPGTVDKSGKQPEWKSIGQLFVESATYKAFNDGKGGSPQRGVTSVLDVEMKAVFETGAGWPPESVRTGRVVPIATRPIQVMDVMPPGSTDMAAVVYMEETTMTNAAAETAEKGVYPAATLALTQRSVTVRKVAVSLPVTDEQLADVAQARSYVDQRLRFMLQQRIDGQIVVGDGNAPNLLGLKNVSGIQTQAKAGDPTPDAVYKALVKCRITGRSQPNYVLMHPTDWQGVRLMKTADGIYLWGAPSDTGPARIWGYPLVESDVDAAGTAYVGDFANFSQLVERKGIEVQIGYVNDDFTRGQQTLRADVRLAAVWYRPAAFCSVTGL